MKKGKKPVKYEWSSMDFSSDSKYPIIWVRPRNSPFGEPTGVPVHFSSKKDFKRFVMSLWGAWGVIKDK